LIYVRAADGTDRSTSTLATDRKAVSRNTSLLSRCSGLCVGFPQEGSVDRPPPELSLRTSYAPRCSRSKRPEKAAREGGRLWLPSFPRVIFEVFSLLCEIRTFFFILDPLPPPLEFSLDRCV
ncbi:unnamed protein product, partial [Phaeothamnion confervicola]